MASWIISPTVWLCDLSWLVFIESCLPSQHNCALTDCDSQGPDSLAVSHWLSCTLYTNTTLAPHRPGPSPPLHLSYTVTVTLYNVTLSHCHTVTNIYSSYHYYYYHHISATYIIRFYFLYWLIEVLAVYLLTSLYWPTCNIWCYQIWTGKHCLFQF